MMEGESSFRGEWAVGSEGDPEVLYVNAWLCYVCVCWREDKHFQPLDYAKWESSPW